MNKILIITHTEDNYSIEKVTEFIHQNGWQTIRLNVDEYPVKSTITTVFRDGKWESWLQKDEEKVRIDDVKSVWYRRAYNIGKGLNEELEPKFYGAAMGEIRATLFGLLESFDCYTLGKPSVYRRIDSKEEQLKISDKLGFNIPETCITNDAAEVRKFMSSIKGEVICKMQTGFAIYEGDVENVVFTNIVTEESLEELDSLRYCPMKFQRKLEKYRELRITVVGREIFAFEIDSQKSEDAKIDWRKDGVNIIEDWIPTQIPDDIALKIHNLLDVYQVDYGAIDMIIEPDGTYYFIEINGAGEFFWLDNLTDGNQISKAIADLLCAKSIRRENTIFQ